MIKKISAVLLTIALMLVSVTPALAAGEVEGTVTASNAAPTITSVTLQATGGGSTTSSMDPLTEYWIEIVAADNNTIDDIEQIDVYIFYDSNGGQDGVGDGTFDSDENAVFKWVKTGSVWSFEKGATSTTWALGTTNASETPASMNVTEGEWNLSFVPGKLAVEAAAAGGASPEWDIYVKVTDASSSIAELTSYTKAMTAYSELSMSAATMNFGAVSLGGTAGIQDAGNKINTVVIANDTHSLGVATEATWTTGTKNITLDPSGTPDAPGEFALNIDDGTSGSGIPTTNQAVTSSSVTIVDHGADARTSTADGADEATSNVDLYMSLTLASSGIDIGSYTGTITFAVTND
ncbi:MAG: hypothetical protein JW750_10220 [Anaerolineaceae bacterium]|nr:hypothetical protein [Anaerolineaceae bacterium]